MCGFYSFSAISDKVQIYKKESKMKNDFIPVSGRGLRSYRQLKVAWNSGNQTAGISKGKVQVFIL